jgi:hypothetical protein
VCRRSIGKPYYGVLLSGVEDVKGREGKIMGRKIMFNLTREFKLKEVTRGERRLTLSSFLPNLFTFD